jgi:hypothetical protein
MTEPPFSWPPATPPSSRSWRKRPAWISAVTRLLPRSRFRRGAWLSAIAYIVGVITIGAIGYALEDGKTIQESMYRALQLFGLNYQAPDDKDPNALIEIARFLAPFVLIAALIKLLAAGFGEMVRLAAHTRTTRAQRDAVLGFGPVGREVGRRLLQRGRRVTWIAFVEGADEALRAARDDAEAMGGFLLIGDPSAPASFARARLERCKRVFVALENDLACLDAAEALRGWLADDAPSPGPRWLKLRGQHMASSDAGGVAIRVFTDSPATHAELEHAAAHGFVSGRGSSSFNLRAEAARRLVVRARFDRTAMLLGQERVHLVIAGCGWQGEALLDEALMLCVRAGLKPPLVTVLDKEADAVRARIARRSPALFQNDLVPGWEPPRSMLCDLETVDFAALDLSPGLSRSVPVTAWAICSGDDDLNLRTSLALQTAMQRRQIAGAAIFARVWAGHAGDTHRLGEDSLTQTNVFGGLSDALDQSLAIDPDPDAISKELHTSYLGAEALAAGVQGAPITEPEERRRREADAVERAVADWKNLSPSKKTSNRRAHRHGAVKLEELGYDWHAGLEERLPVFNPDQTSPWDDAEAALAAEGNDFLRAEDSVQARFLAAMKSEHDRWIIDRAIDGWRHGTRRDEGRRIHPDMTVWDQLKAGTRAYDGLLLRGLMRRPTTQKDAPPAFTHAPLVMRLAQGAPMRTSRTQSDWDGTTELQVILPPGNLERPEKTVIDLAERPLASQIDLIRSLTEAESFCRLVLVFPAPPAAAVLALANKLAGFAWARGRDVHALWAWKEGAGGPTFDPETPHEALLCVQLKKPAARDRVLGFTGHRALGDPAAARALLEDAFQSWLSEDRPVRPVLLTGFAEGADRMAVELWRARGGEVHYLFPWPDPQTKNQSRPTHAWTDNPAMADAALCRIALADHGVDPNATTVLQPPGFEGENGHVLLANHLIGQSDALIALWNGDRSNPRPGGVADVVLRAN